MVSPPIPLVSRRCGSTGIINGITVIAPGTSIALHRHNCEESVLVFDGEAIAEIDGTRHAMAPNDTTWVPANVPHRFINASDQRPMRIFWTYATIVHPTRTSVATGETRTIDDERA